jgi:hypothetical protein
MDEKLIELLYANFGIWAVLLVTVVLLFWRLGAELTKLRQQVAYEVNRDLLAKRFEAYGALWAKMKPFAIKSSRRSLNREPLRHARISMALCSRYRAF